MKIQKKKLGGGVWGVGGLGRGGMGGSGWGGLGGCERRIKVL